jgi:hypothetical protein
VSMRHPSGRRTAAGLQREKISMGSSAWPPARRRMLRVRLTAQGHFLPSADAERPHTRAGLTNHH